MPPNGIPEGQAVEVAAVKIVSATATVAPTPKPAAGPQSPQINLAQINAAAAQQQPAPGLTFDLDCWIIFILLFISSSTTIPTTTISTTAIRWISTTIPRIPTTICKQSCLILNYKPHLCNFRIYVLITYV